MVARHQARNSSADDRTGNSSGSKRVAVAQPSPFASRGGVGEMKQPLVLFWKKDVRCWPKASKKYVVTNRNLSAHRNQNSLASPNGTGIIVCVRQQIWWAKRCREWQPCCRFESKTRMT